jgi:hypothetical protein
MLQQHDGLLLQCLMSECAEALRSWNIMEYHGIQNLRSIASLCVWSSARCRQPELNAPNGSALKPQQIMAGCHGSVGVLAMAVSAMDSFDVLRFTAMGVRLGGL